MAHAGSSFPVVRRYGSSVWISNVFRFSFPDQREPRRVLFEFVFRGKVRPHATNAVHQRILLAAAPGVLFLAIKAPDVIEGFFFGSEEGDAT